MRPCLRGAPATTNTQPAHNIRPYNSFSLPDSRTSYAHIPITFALAFTLTSTSTTCSASLDGEPDLYHAYVHWAQCPDL
jgi:hypothetical protein